MEMVLIPVMYLLLGSKTLGDKIARAYGKEGEKKKIIIREKNNWILDLFKPLKKPSPSQFFITRKTREYC